MKAMLVVSMVLAMVAAMLGLTGMYHVAEFRPLANLGHFDGLFPTVTFFYVIAAWCVGMMAVLLRREIRNPS